MVCVDPLGVPADLVTLTIFKGATEHREADDVGVPGRMGESSLPVHADKQGYVLLT
jgi:hypothetical protein